MRGARFDDQDAICDALPAVIDPVDKAEDNIREFVEKRRPAAGRLSAPLLSERGSRPKSRG